MAEKLCSIGLKPVDTFHDFLEDLDLCGFSIAGTNPEGVFTLCDCFTEHIIWHTGQPETDPWMWRIRCLEERDDIAYAKFFCKKAGYIKRTYYARFMAIRRHYNDIRTAYQEGVFDRYTRYVYEAISYAGVVSMHELKKLLGITREVNGQFERALTTLQMLFYITICGARQKISSDGESYGWHSTLLCTTEVFWGNEMLYEAQSIDPVQAYIALEKQIYCINPNADARKVQKFICGLSPFSV